MSIWFTATITPAAGSLAAVTAALAAEKIAIEGIVGSAESGDGVVHLAVAESAHERALAVLGALGVSVHLDEGALIEPGGADGLIGAILNGPRT
ncbi:MAG: hypothetical protein RL546_523 [Chloroflexota bacterium]|jgi:hypothetical protein